MSKTELDKLIQSDIKDQINTQKKKAEENDKENLKYMSTEEALNQIKQRIMMHELDDTTSNENEREKVILNYINELQDRINRALRYMSNYIEVEDAPLNENVRCEFKEIINILKGE